MSIKIENENLVVRIKKKGAELYSVVNKENQLEYMWGADPLFWGKTSPVLFPVVGELKDNVFIYKDKSYIVTRHGFARDMSFDVIAQRKDSATFSLKSNEQTLRNYPFPFELQIEYSLRKDILDVTYVVINSGNEKMYFSIGAHPAFKLPLTSNSQYNDYSLTFNTTSDVDQWALSKEGLIEPKPSPLLVNSNKLKLSKQLFYKGALVLKNISFDKIELKANDHEPAIDFHCEGFPYFGIWAAKDADFLCLEPWCGIADSTTHNQQLETKEGMEKISAGEEWKRTWSARFY